MECDLMETDILESLEDLGYKGPLLEDGALSQAVSAGASSPEFTKLCAWLVSELRVLCKLDENVQATNSPSEAEEFQLEVSGLLGEMNCPYLSLTSGDVTKRLLIQKNCLLLLTYLISELEAARMLCVNTLPKKAQEGGGSEVFQELKGICIALGMSKPPANITMFQFFSGIEKKLKETLAKVPPNHVGKPLLKKPMGPAHWEKIEAINQAVANEYEVRRKLLIKRLDVTVQSFGWSDRAKSQTEKLAKVYQPKRSVLSPKSTISVAHLLAARQDLSKILRTSSGSIREKTACAINKVMRVPLIFFKYIYFCL
uniref:Family with sequence similarity 98 member A n=1 Tax=Phocoena sinus TaxID=42100 RepID=A0A8C9C0R4_PHOSS